ncbi:RcpC/CpaB family pilus assembly protein [Streptomyces sp. TRM 70361]|uniref:RcpC/CpaB family pilus assembly protein n=1 Tax=Streptomyces sp. TRM 70361 TaxID=3116553 RepID=UPI002E7B3DA3|nr:RcpC/CpaB family pilus assembly protein [Streptomyces sp. TRM 70361]MEE1938433.1 RcpC/CpaB family pilus assembly protein [Streptomyces sp. TRM 70361]
MPEFEPVRTGRGLLGPLRTAGRGRRAVAVSLAAAATVAVAWAPRGGPGGESAPSALRPAAERAPAPPAPPVPPASASARSSPGHGGDTAAEVEAPVRIPDAAVVRLLRPGDRVDVLATAVDGTAAGVPADRPARTVARNVRVAAVPGPGPDEPGSGDSGASGLSGASGEEAGALVVLSVPRPVAARLAGAAAHSRLAVVLC